jgi:hypothetical protein
MIVAGPLTTEYVMAPDELELADTVKGASMVWWFGTVNTMVGSGKTVSVLPPDADA